MSPFIHDAMPYQVEFYNTITLPIENELDNTGGGAVCRQPTPPLVRQHKDRNEGDKLHAVIEVRMPFVAFTHFLFRPEAAYITPSFRPTLFQL